ncbi:uncharacterized protein KY384_000523 [Bacidia gigantensis]|uniref:uncharacterized protein n=1 Tax=Bacidia gigantensis TaxID=2732470 RepID=UPI001D056878|nr:uncharacterized protein KY384_000523 [Bacidia gigantensis]KAG8525763.1 hypothetical protein KY384_000523 [Bacidia gigantensis]
MPSPIESPLGSEEIRWHWREDLREIDENNDGTLRSQWSTFAKKSSREKTIWFGRSELDRRAHAAPKKRRKEKPYVPKHRSGAYALLMVLSQEESCQGLIKSQLIDQAQPLSDASFIDEGQTKYFTAWNSMKTLMEKDLVYKRGRPVEKYMLTEEGWEIAHKMRGVEKGQTLLNDNPRNEKGFASIADMSTSGVPERAASNIVDLEDLSNSELNPAVKSAQAHLSRRNGPFEGLSSKPHRDEASKDKKIPSSKNQARKAPTQAAVVDLLSSPEPPETVITVQGSVRAEDIERSSKSVLPEDSRQIRNSLPTKPTNQEAKRAESLPTFKPIVVRPGEFSVRLLLDNREVRSKEDREYIAKTLSQLGTEVLFGKEGTVGDVRPLPLGDICWVARLHDRNLLASHGEEGQEIALDWIVERKRFDDLVSSIIDKRFNEQKYRLGRSGMKVVYLIEQTHLSEERAKHFQEQIKGAIAGTQVINGYFLQRTQKLDESIRYLHRMTTLLKSLYEKKPLHVIPSSALTSTNYLPLLAHLRKHECHLNYNVTFPAFSSLASKSDSLTLRDVYLKMLMCTRGISGEKAIAIQKIWPTPRALVEAFESCETDKQKQGMLDKKLGGLMGKNAIKNVSAAQIPPRPPGQRVQRLDSLKNPQPRPRPRIQKATPERCVNPDCTEPTSLTVEDGKLVCESCGTVADDSPDLVTDLQYGLEGGRAVVHGHHVGVDSGQVRGEDVAGINRQMSGLEQTNATGEDLAFSLTIEWLLTETGRRYAVQICAALQINPALQEAGLQFFRLAASMNFIQGRRTKSVAAVALYIACRCQRENPNHYMLIDFADILNLNVFTLGTVYTDLVNALRVNPNGFLINPINPEDLIFRFAQRLEFGPETMRVANDAVRIVQRMNRDWMTPGRRPAGICGAALILAARMNNFRRTSREMVYVVKVNEVTIFKRLEEFKALESSGQSVQEFRTKDLEGAHDPPAFNQNKDGMRKKKKGKRKERRLEFDDDGEDVSPSRAVTDPAILSSNMQLSTPVNTQQGQAASQSMPPPPIPIDPGIASISGAEMTSQTPGTTGSLQSPESSLPTGQGLLGPPITRKRKQPTRSSARKKLAAAEQETDELQNPTPESSQGQMASSDRPENAGTQERAEADTAASASIESPSNATSEDTNLSPSNEKPSLNPSLSSAGAERRQTRSATRTSLRGQPTGSDIHAKSKAGVYEENLQPGAMIITSQSEESSTTARRRSRRRKQDEGSQDPTIDPQIATALGDPFDLDTDALQSTMEVACAAEAESSEIAQTPREIPTSATIDESEFLDDAEVEHCLLNEEEVRIKTRIWTSVNADWLRAQAAKRLKYEMAVAAGTYRPKKTRQRRRQRIGDLKQYASQLGPDWEQRLEAGEVLASTTAEAVEMMMKKRAYSSRINYELLRNVYTPSSSGSRRTSIGGAGSPGSGTRPQDTSAGSATSGQATAGRTEREVEMEEEVESQDGEQATRRAASEETDMQQRELDSMVGELEEQGIYGDPHAVTEEAEDNDEDDVVSQNNDDDDPYEAIGAESD